MDKFLSKLRRDFPAVTFVRGETFAWSARTQTITYPADPPDADTAAWSLLHELGHAELGHASYRSDLELVRLEAAAWHRAAALAKRYDAHISPDYIQNCLDTYRDWLHRRSTCPTCGTTSLQTDSTTYQCHNCHTRWHVSRSLLCRPYRRRVAGN